MEDDEIPDFGPRPNTNFSSSPYRSQEENLSAAELRSMLQVLTNMVGESNARLAKLEAIVGVLRNDVQSMRQSIRTISLSQGGGGTLKTSQQNNK